VGDIVRAVEGDVLAHSPAGEGQSSAKTSAVWAEISKKFEAQLDAVNVEDLMSAPAKEMWYI
jgi:DNA-binding IscR family transcriptional regulator